MCFHGWLFTLVMSGSSEPSFRVHEQLPVQRAAEIARRFADDVPAVRTVGPVGRCDPTWETYRKTRENYHVEWIQMAKLTISMVMFNSFYGVNPALLKKTVNHRTFYGPFSSKLLVYQRAEDCHEVSLPIDN